MLAYRLETFSEILDELKGVIDAFQKQDPQFPKRSLKWLTDAENVMASARLKEGAEFSTLRGGIIQANFDSYGQSEKPSRRIIRDARYVAASEALKRGERILRERLLEAEAKLNHFEDKLIESITAASLVGLIPSRSGENRSTWLKKVWESLDTHKAIHPTLVYIAASIDRSDRLYLLDNVLARLQG